MESTRLVREYNQNESIGKSLFYKYFSIIFPLINNIQNCRLKAVIINDNN